MKKIFLSLALLLSVERADAFKIEPYLFTSYGEAVHPNESESPAMFGHGIGVSALFDIYPMISLGVSGDYRLYNQASEVKAPYGNRTGKRLAISPTLGLKVGPLFFKYYYHLAGDYKLDNTTSSGNEVTYTDVAGHSFWLSIPVFPLIRVGAFYEIESFETSINGTTETNLTTNKNQLEFNKFGLYFSILI